MNKIIKKICDNITNQHKTNKNVLGVLLFGSAARNKFDQYSDIDIYILLRKKEKSLRYNFVKENIRVDVILNTLEEAESFLKKETFSVKRNTSHMLAHGKILYAVGNHLKRMMSMSKHNLELPTKYTQNEILMHKYSIDDFWGEIQRDIKNKNYLAFGLDSQLLLNNIVELFLKKHGEFLRPPNEMLDTLNKIDKQLARQVERFFKTNNIGDKKTILKKLVVYTFKKFGTLPKKWLLSRTS